MQLFPRHKSRIRQEPSVPRNSTTRITLCSTSAIGAVYLKNFFLCCRIMIIKIGVKMSAYSFNQTYRLYTLRENRHVLYASAGLPLFLCRSLSFLFNGQANFFSNFSCMFLNPNNFFQFEF